ncbi:MAG TPA: chemotaxis protein CheW [Planctomycetota bacterium]
MNERVRALRREFDASFAAPPRSVGEASESFLAIRVAGDPYAIPLGDIAALAARPATAPLPSRRPECLGLVGRGGALAALYSLPALLGAAAGTSTPRWMALLRAGTGLALGFEDYEGYARFTLSELSPLGEGAKRRHVSRAARHGGTSRLIIDIASIVNDLTA